MLRAIALVSALTISFALGQQPTSATSETVPDDAVVVVLNGKRFTAGEIKRYVAVLPNHFQKAFAADPKQFMRDHAFLMFLREYAEKNKLGEKSPLKEQLEYATITLLAQAAYDHASKQFDITGDQQQKYYDENKEVFREAQVRMIYVPFADLGSEGEAKAKAEALAKRAKAGEDFAKLAKEASPDAMDTPFAVRMSSSQPPPPMRRTILALKKGDVTDALRHDNGYYVFRVESTDVLPFEKVRDEVYVAIRDAKFREWERKAKSQATVQFENEAFFQDIGKDK